MSRFRCMDNATVFDSDQLLIVFIDLAHRLASAFLCHIFVSRRRVGLVAQLLQRTAAMAAEQLVVAARCDDGPAA